MEQWQDAASQQLRLLTSRLNELLTKGLEWLRSEFGVDVGLKPELIPPWIILLAACSGLLLMVALWASVCRTIFRKRPAVSSVDDGVEGKRGASKPVKAEEPKKKKKKAEKKAQPNGRAVAEAQEGATACEERVPHHQAPPPQVKTDKLAETKKSKKKAKPSVKETKAATGDGKEPEEGTWETKVSNKEKREQRKKDKNSSDGSASPGGGDTPVNAPPEQPRASAAPPAPPASQKKKKGESAKAKAEKAEAAVSQANSSVVPEVAAATADMAVKVAPQSAAPKTSSWTTQRQTASLWRAGSDESWTVPVPSPELNLVSLSSLGVPQTQPVSDLTWLNQPRVDDEWSGLNGGSADPSSDWNAPSEAWGNYEEPTAEPAQLQELLLPEPDKAALIAAAEDDEDDKDKGDATTDGAAKTKKKKKKKKKTSEEGGTPGQVDEPAKEAEAAPAPAVSVKKPPPVEENAAAVQSVKAAAVEARGDRPMKDTISQKPPVTQVPQKPTDGDPAAKQNNLPAPTQQSVLSLASIEKTDESQVPKPAKKKKARRET
ncbi:protein LYRIC-like isoform X1 [Poecilia latipinna]|uniref:protein LYRIC-like isoform X1 n=1 Tax=Poecilia latipinna TaxID=48699 RepID=UPI00072E1C8A|nr:PREDICTED: protein LYRIC-like isoform X1 [Poecilia latipinna]